MQMRLDHVESKNKTESSARSLWWEVNHGVDKLQDEHTFFSTHATDCGIILFLILHLNKTAAENTIMRNDYD